MSKDTMKVIFVARNYPPTLGGAEKLNYDIARNLEKYVDLEIIKNKYGKYSLFFHLHATLKILSSKKKEIIFLSDPFLSPMIPILKLLKQSPIVIKVNGLDITFKNICYQYFIPKLTNMADNIVCISEATKRECIKRGIEPNNCTVIPIGIDENEVFLNTDKHILRNVLSKKIDVNLGNVIILSVGRLVERKGFHWFTENVIPKIVYYNQNFSYLVVGDGIFKEKIESIIHQKCLQKHVIMLGKVDDEMLKILYNASDIFVMPNIPVEGDMEGFGIVSIEAASCGLPVVASNIEGIKDAIQDGLNGFLVESSDVDEFVKIITELLENPKEREGFGKIARDFTLKNYSWEKIAKKYCEVFEVEKC